MVFCELMGAVSVWEIRPIFCELTEEFCELMEVRGVTVKIDFSPFARETLPLALEHAQG